MIHVSKVPELRSVHSIIWQGEVTEMNIDGIKCLRLNLCPRNPTPGELHHQTQAGIQVHNLLSL